MKIGILTLFHGNNNWGGVLQGYALKTLLEQKYENVQVDILVYKSKNNIVYPSILKQMQQYNVREIFSLVNKKINKKSVRKVHGYLKERYKLFKDFQNIYKTNETVYTDATLIEAAKEYDCLISGSDQVWNPNVGRAGYFQAMIKDECKKVAYAASIARDDLSKEEQSIMIPCIERFDYVSVREKTAKKILDKYITNGKEVTETLDPVLMLTKDQWNLAFKEKNTDDEKYCLAFFFSESRKYRTEISKLAKEKNIKLKYIPFAANTYISSDLKGPGEPCWNVGPEEFIRLFQNAECVFTDSFHGAVFSIIFQKPFCVFERDKNTKVSKNSRLYDLLEKFGLSERLVKQFSVSDLSEIINKPIDYNKVDDLLMLYRNESLEFITKSLE